MADSFRGAFDPKGFGHVSGDLSASADLLGALAFNDLVEISCCAMSKSAWDTRVPRSP